jgi:hypothetical protein
MPTTIAHLVDESAPWIDGADPINRTRLKIRSARDRFTDVGAMRAVDRSG